MEKEIRTSHRRYRIEYYECEDGLYKLVIYDLKGVVQTRGCSWTVTQKVPWPST